MKRTPLARSKPIQARKPMNKVSAKRKAKKASPEGKAGKLHMLRVKMLPCVICNAPPPNDAHHCYHDRYGTAKESDFDTIPLCKFCHQEGPLSVHKAKATWRELHGPDYSYLDRVQKLLTTSAQQE